MNKMKSLTTNHNGIKYEFRLLEQYRVIEIIKGEELTYHIKWKVGYFYCNCPSGFYRRRCWHLGMINKINQYPSIQEPWAEWVEDAGRMMYGVL